jgi:cytochrome P450
LLPVFSPERLPEYGPIITCHSDRTMAAWKDDGTHDIYRDIMRLTLDVAAEAFLGTQLNGRQDALLKNLATIRVGFIVQADQCFMVPAWVPTRSNRAIRRAVKAILAIGEGIIRDRPPRFEDLPRLTRLQQILRNRYGCIHRRGI